MKKYWQIFSIGIAQMFVWRLNFVLWRVRVILRFLLLYFLWSTVFLQRSNLFGYDRAQMLTYVVGVAFLASLVISSRNQDVAGEIRDGELTNFLLKPVSYFGWWWARDLVDKTVNVVFAIVELGTLYILLRPEIFLQTNLYWIILSTLAAILAIILWFYFSFIVSLSAFWIAEVWGIRFLTFVAIDVLSGGIFPIDVLPAPLYHTLSLTPFPYLLYFPMKVYLGQLSAGQLVTGFGVLLAWIVFSVFATQIIWIRGIKVYGGEGR